MAQVEMRFQRAEVTAFGYCLVIGLIGQTLGFARARMLRGYPSLVLND